jgi:hypothetical protein
MKEKPPKEVSDWMRQIQAKRKSKKGHPIKHKDPEHKKKREYMKQYRERLKQRQEAKDEKNG